MPRQGLTREIIRDEAVKLVNQKGYKELSFTQLASGFNVKPPAMFKHFKSLEELKEMLTLYGVKLLKQKLQDAVTGLSEEKAIFSLCHAYRNFAKTNPGLYQAIQPSFFGKNKEVEQAAMQMMGIIISVLKGFNIAEENFIHLIRVIRSSLHGFVVLEIEFGFGMPVSSEKSFDHLINAIIFMIKSFTD